MTRKQVSGARLALVLWVFSAPLWAEDPATRALEYEKRWSFNGRELQWQIQDVPEYLHPEFNDTGISAGWPTFVEKLPRTEGEMVMTSLRVVETTLGRDRYMLKGKQDIAVVRVRYTVVAASTKGKMEYYSTPKEQDQYLIMAQDPKDKKWKLLDKLPAHTYYHLVPDALRRWDSEFGRPPPLNGAEVKKKLEALAQKLR